MIKTTNINEIVNKFLLAGDKFRPEMHLKYLRFTYSACGPFTKKKEIIQKFKETKDTKYIYGNELDKACFQHYMTFEDLKDFARRTATDKVLRDKAFNIAKNPKLDGYQRGLASIIYNFFDKKSTSSIVNNEIKQNHQLAKKLHKPIIRKFRNKSVYSAFSTSDADLADMQSISRFNKKVRFLLCAIDIYSKYAWIVLLKDKKSCKHC